MTVPPESPWMGCKQCTPVSREYQGRVDDQQFVCISKTTQAVYDSDACCALHRGDVVPNAQAGDVIRCLDTKKLVLQSFSVQYPYDRIQIATN